MQALILHPTGAGTLLAAAALAAGAPLFSDGLRALRLRRGLRALVPAALADRPAGLTQVSGRVALESPLFAPLSGRPCAGFRLAVSSTLQPVPRHVEEWRDFRLVEGNASAQVAGASAHWDLMVTGCRDVAPGEPLTEHLQALLARVPDGRWLRGSRQPLRLVEHALFAGATAHVVGSARTGETVARAAEVEYVRTGTDAIAVAVTDPAAGAEGEPELWLERAEPYGVLRVSDAPPHPARVRVSALRVSGLALGPALSLGGMLYLANVADWLHGHGGF